MLNTAFLFLAAGHSIEYQFPFIKKAIFLIDCCWSLINLAGEANLIISTVSTFIQSCAVVPSKLLYICVISVQRLQHFLYVRYLNCWSNSMRCTCFSLLAPQNCLIQALLSNNWWNDCSSACPSAEDFSHMWQVVWRPAADGPVSVISWKGSARWSVSPHTSACATSSCRKYERIWLCAFFYHWMHHWEPFFDLGWN